jgi:hypothetical protein
MNTESAIRPGWVWYLLAGVLFLSSLAAVPGGLLLLLVRENSASFRFTVPGQSEIHIQKAGTYVLWNEHETIHQGRTYSSGEKLPDGMHIELRRAETGAVVEMTPDLTTRERRGKLERNSVGKFQIAAPGKYSIVVEGDFPERVFLLRESLLKTFAPKVFTLIAMSLLGMLVSAILALAVFLRRRSARLTPYGA